MRATETKEITKVVREEVAVKRICDNCGQEITSERRAFGDGYNYFHITIRYYDWGNDSVESYKTYDACCPACALEMAEKYVVIAYRGYNTKTVEIEHVCNLKKGTD